MANKRIDQLGIASNAEVQLATKIPIDVNGNMKSAKVQQIGDKILANIKTVNGQSLIGDGNITVTGSAMVNAGNITVVDFTTSKYYGNISSAVSGNITYNLTNAVSGAKAIIFHQDSTEPILPIKTFKKNSVDTLL